MTELDALVWENLKRLHELGVLDDDERVVDHEQVGWRTAPGVLILSQRRVLFFRASPLTARTRSLSIGLNEVESVTASERRAPIRKHGTLTISTGEPDERYGFEYISGGKVRAEEIARAILDQRAALVELAPE